MIGTGSTGLQAAQHPPSLLQVICTDNKVIDRGKIGWKRCRLTGRDTRDMGGVRPGAVRLQKAIIIFIEGLVI
jgi:hypothetical protein